MKKKMKEINKMIKINRINKIKIQKKIHNVV